MLLPLLFPGFPSWVGQLAPQLLQGFGSMLGVVRMSGDRLTEVSAQPVASETSKKRSFEVTLPVFSGPFDLLLSLIAKHKLDVTEVALAEVADDFVAHIRTAGFDLDQATEFLVVAATLLDLKAARLLPTPAREDDEEDLALLEARDLLFARLLQYRAYKRAATLLAGLEAMESRHRARRSPSRSSTPLRCPRW